MNNIQLLWVSKTGTPVGNFTKPHFHAFYHAVYVYKGELTVSIDGEEQTLCVGECMIIPKGTMHCFSNKTDLGVKQYELKFSILNQSFDAAVREIGNTVINDALTCMLFEKIVAEYSEYGHAAENSAASYMNSLLYNLTAHTRFVSIDGMELVETESYSELSKRIMSYLEENYARDVSLSELADYLGMNKNYICGAFKRDTHTNIGDCKNIIRIRKAAEFITYGEMSLAAVAQKCGFATVAHFNRIFTKYAGITPGQCRRAYPSDTVAIPDENDVLNPRKTGNPFIYSVMAGKSISLGEIHEYNKAHKDDNF